MMMAPGTRTLRTYGGNDRLEAYPIDFEQALVGSASKRDWLLTEAAMRKEPLRLVEEGVEQRPQGLFEPPHASCGCSHP